MPDVTGTILVVDDQPTVRYTVRRFLEHAGFVVTEAATGEAALVAARSRPQPDAILLDVKLPGLTGYEVCRQLKASADTADVPVIHLTATYADDVSKVRGLEGGADAYLTHPIEPHVLVATIGSLLRLKRSREELGAMLEREKTAHKAAEEARRRFEYLSKAAARLSSSLELAETLETTASLGAPGLADYCFVDVLESPGFARRVAVAPADRRETEGSVWAVPDDARGTARALTEGKTDCVQLSGDGPDPGVDPFNQELLARLGATSLVAIPLAWRGQRGAMTLVSKSNPCHEDDVHLAEQLALRAATSIENARLYDELRLADRAKEDFIAMLAHELRNPLEPIVAAAHVVASPDSAGERAERAREIIFRQTRQMARLIDDLLDISRINSGRIELRRQSVEIGALLRETAHDYRPQLDQRGLRFETDLADSPLFADADPARIAQVVGNLLHNAAKFTPEGGSVVLSSRRTAEGVSISVKDSGGGMTRDVVASLFRPFSQGERSFDRGHGGLGLGLALAHGLVSLHDGTIAAESAGPGRGAEFVVTLPLVATPLERRPAQEVPTAHQPLRILIVEDNIDAAVALSDFLELSGHVIRMAHTGTAAIGMAREHRPEVVVCDLGLPGMDGFEVAAALRREPSASGAYIVALSGYGQPEDRAKALAAGFDVHLTKPIDPAELERTLLRTMARA